MKKELRFREHTAILSAGNGRAILTVDAPVLPTPLADVIDSNIDIDVTEVFMADHYVCIRMEYDLQQWDLLATVCEAIEEVYISDIRVSDARSKNIV